MQSDDGIDSDEKAETTRRERGDGRILYVINGVQKITSRLILGTNLFGPATTPQTFPFPKNEH